MAGEMQLLTKFESKSSRAKGIAFHPNPNRPWILTSLHNGTIQLWDYRMGTLLDRFEEHDGPVRGIAFHPTKEMFVSGGDDYKIKVWNYKTRKCLFTLNGHLDYVRTVFFHHEYPWILSASDDQTIRIWNWQSRTCIAILTGHNHYVMCAQFHPKEDLIVSASLDQTVRVWDISNLRKKSAVAPQTMTFEEQMARANSAAAGAGGDLFGNQDAVCRFVLDGHDRGVNWVSFHPTLPLIVSAGDDRLVKLWRMSETKAWEVDTCRGHFHNACAALFHPRQELLLSCGEDKTLRVWNLNTRSSVASFRRENDRFWVVVAHPEINLFAAGHDSGVMVFKLERERPASSVYANSLFWVTKEKYVRSYDMTSNTTSQNLVSLRKLGNAWTQPRTLSYNPAERSVLVTSSVDNGVFVLANLPRDGSGSEETEFTRGSGNSAFWVARNRFAVFHKASNTIEIRDLSNAVTKTIKPTQPLTDVYYGGAGMLVFAFAAGVGLYDIAQGKQIADLQTPLIKKVVWSNDGSHVALLGKHTVTIATKNLEQVSSLHETIRIKSATWDDTGVLLYSTLNHIKYTLLNGDNGIIRTLEQPMYLVKVKGKNVFCLDRSAKTVIYSIDPTEYRFKLALVKRNYEEMLHIIRTSNLVGQSIISYLQKKGYPEIALQFVQDPQTRFALALECGNLDIALEEAKTLDRPEVWTKLGEEALRQGNHQVVEMTYQKQKAFDKLSFLYLATGNQEKLGRMLKIAEHRGDYMSQFQNSLFLGDVESRIRMLKECDLYPLAYMTAKTAGLEAEAQEILEACGMSEEEIKMPKTMGGALQPPAVVSKTFEANWPLRPASQSKFEQTLLNQVANMSLEDAPATPAEEKWDDANEGAGAGADLIDVEGDEDEEGGWDMGDDDIVLEAPEEEQVAEDVGPSQPGTSEADLWVRNSPLAADHVAAGSFESAMQLLNRQIGAVNFEPLKPRFMAIFQASKTYLPAGAGLPSLENHVRRNPDETDPRKILPVIPRDLSAVTRDELQEAYKLVKANNIGEAVTLFRTILHTLLLTAVSSQSEAEELTQLVEVCKEYILGLSIELTRREIGTDPEQLKRNLELAAYFTRAKLQPAHKQLALRSAMNSAYKAKNFDSAAKFAHSFEELVNGGGGKALEQARMIIQAGDRNPRDAVEIHFDHFAEFEVCAASNTPIYLSSPSVRCPFDQAAYLPEYKGSVCKICQVSAVGQNATGLRVTI
ncbi:hypothetical protein YB2330_001941 [Saitoella coloradoensis]